MMDGRLGKNPLKDTLGDALHAVICGAGHNLRLILAKLRLLPLDSGSHCTRCWRRYCRRWHVLNSRALEKGIVQDGRIMPSKRRGNSCEMVSCKKVQGNGRLTRIDCNKAFLE